MEAVDDTSAQLGGVSATASDEFASLLLVIFDANSDGWASHSPEINFREALAATFVLLNAHLALDSNNKVAVIGWSSRGPKLLYPSSGSSEHQELAGIMYRQFRTVDETVLTELFQMMEPPTPNAKCSVAGPLSLALCYMNQILNANESRLNGRILVVNASGDVSTKYIPTINSIFAAQKLQVPIDVCNIGGTKTFLQQAADFTGGAYLEPMSTKGLVQYFTGGLLVDPATRKFVNIPTAPEVDFSAVCFVTKKVLEIGYVCSVCLCIMEEPPKDNHCPVCSTEYSKT